MVLSMLRKITGEERSLSLCRNAASLNDDVSAPVVVPSRRRTWPVRPALADLLEDDIIDFHGTGRFSDNYTEAGCIGVGTSATVHTCISKADGSRWVVKVMEVTNGSKKPEDGSRAESGDCAGPRPSLRQEVLKELEVMAALRGEENFAGLREFFEQPSESNLQDSTFHIVLEEGHGGDVLSALSDLGTLSEADARIVMRSLMHACEAMRRHEVIHRDIKPDNLVLASPSGFGGGVKLIDFGLSKCLRHGPPTEVCGTPYFVAPEVLDYAQRRHLGKSHGRTSQELNNEARTSEQTYGYECDVWSCGVTLFVLLSGHYPFYGGSMPGLYKAIRKGHVTFDDVEWGGVSESAKDLIKRLLTVCPEKRITPEEALEHPWLRA